MKLTIEYSKTKRSIGGTFSICGSREDLTEMVHQIENKLRDESWSYGWVDVHTTPTRLANVPVTLWDDAA